ncbi:protein S100-Z isoform 2-T2 [Syngnathus typhle]
MLITGYLTAIVGGYGRHFLHHCCENKHDLLQHIAARKAEITPNRFWLSFLMSHKESVMGKRRVISIAGHASRPGTSAKRPPFMRNGEPARKENERAWPRSHTTSWLAEIRLVKSQSCQCGLPRKQHALKSNFLWRR